MVPLPRTAPKSRKDPVKVLTCLGDAKFSLHVCPKFRIYKAWKTLTPLSLHGRSSVGLPVLCCAGCGHDTCYRMIKVISCEVAN